MTLAIECLKEGLECKDSDWLDCVDVWAAFEKKIGFQSSTSVSTNCNEFLDCCTHKDLGGLYPPPLSPIGVHWIPLDSYRTLIDRVMSQNLKSYRTNFPRVLSKFGGLTVESTRLPLSYLI